MFLRDRLDLDPSALSGFDGYRVIPDVHGDYDALEAALASARAARRYVVQLGDLIDRGPYSPFCVERMLEVEAEGQGTFLLGNHEVAFAEFVAGGRAGAARRQETLLQFEEHGGGLLERFVARIAQGPFWIAAPGLLFVHAAFHPRMLDASAAGDEALREIAYHGYGTSKERRAGKFERGWVDQVPRGLTVVVGHAVTASRTVEAVTGRLGGVALFADTGAWTDEGGDFPVLDLPFAA